MTRAFTLQDFPEELLEHILGLCVSAQSQSGQTSPPRRPQWHTPAFQTRRTSPLRVCKTFYRIATPLLYHNVHVVDVMQAELLLRTLQGNASISPLIRSLVLSTITLQSAQILSLCKGLLALDFTLDAASSSSPPSPPNSQGDAVDPAAVYFSNAIMTQRHIQHLVVRKPDARAYLTMPRIKYVLSGLAHALLSWNKLETANFAFKFADDSRQGGPIVQLTHALSNSPRLHSFAAHVPATWSEAILRVSTNRRMERIVLTDGRVDVSVIPEFMGGCPPLSAPEHQQGGVLGTGLFFMEARKHSRLSELIKAGTPFVRCRARSFPAGQSVPMRATPVTLVATRSADSFASASSPSSAPSSPTSHVASAKLPKRKKPSSSPRPVSTPSFHL